MACVIVQICSEHRPDCNGWAFMDSVTETLFGPLMRTESEAQSFKNYCGADPRLLANDVLDRRWESFSAERRKVAEDCAISIELDVLGEIRFEYASITVNGKEAHCGGSWSLVDIINFAAFEVIPEGETEPFGAWHSHIYIEGIQVNGNEFEVSFGS
jgi:hypothetical protein